MSSPTLSALNLKLPFLLIVAHTALSPSFFSTGMLSPVIADSSTKDEPSITTPSAGIELPGLTSTISPTTMSLVSISVSMPFLITIAFLGAKLRSLFIASLFCL